MVLLLHCGIDKNFSYFCKVSKKWDNMQSLSHFFRFFSLFFVFSPLKTTKRGKRGNNMALCGNKTKPITTHIPLSFSLLHQMWQQWQ